MQEWEKYFMKLLEGRKEKEKMETEITVEEIERQIKKMKKKKAPGRDGVQNEGWIYGTEGIVERLVEVTNGVCRGERFPVDWREGVICAIYKKGEKNKVENYRGITLLNTWCS
jgi:hypothetical protein